MKRAERIALEEERGMAEKHFQSFLTSTLNVGLSDGGTKRLAKAFKEFGARKGSVVVFVGGRRNVTRPVSQAEHDDLLKKGIKPLPVGFPLQVYDGRNRKLQEPTARLVEFTREHLAVVKKRVNRWMRANKGTQDARSVPGHLRSKLSAMGLDFHGLPLARGA